MSKPTQSADAPAQQELTEELHAAISRAIHPLLGDAMAMNDLYHAVDMVFKEIRPFLASGLSAAQQDKGWAEEVMALLRDTVVVDEKHYLDVTTDFFERLTAINAHHAPPSATPEAST